MAFLVCATLISKKVRAPIQNFVSSVSIIPTAIVFVVSISVSIVCQCVSTNFPKYVLFHVSRLTHIDTRLTQILTHLIIPTAIVFT